MGAHVPAASRQWRNVPLVRERDVRRTRWFWALLLGIFAAAAPAALYLLQQMEYVQVRYRIEELREQRQRLEESERRLRIERATLEALPRVEAEAVSALGFVRPSPREIVVVRHVAPARGGAAPRAPSRDAATR